jgi:bifunctional non-homologous end joining protein LigD
MGLREYRKKRDFERTPEPPPKTKTKKSGRSFVVQKHAATRLHYDFRLELDGVLLSWAVPKGPSPDPKERRLAMRTEDHPVEYGTFEGVIPKGEYGGGTVLLWDRGTWEPEGDPKKDLKKGHLRFALHGEKLAGRWTLVRTSRGSEDKEAWLLIKRSGDDGLIRDDEASVISGRTMDAIAGDPDRVWHSKGSARMPDAKKVHAAKQRAMPAKMHAELATRVDAAPTGKDWIHEIKWDGYRILARIEGGEVALFTRNQLDWTAKLPSLARALRELPVKSAWLDGEIVVLDDEGKSRFGLLQHAIGPRKDADVRYVMFDLLYLEGHDLRAAPLVERKKILEALLRRTGGLEGRLRYSDHVEGDGPAFFEHACELGLEGIICKRADRPYVERRTRDWLKIKCCEREELYVGGFTEPSGSRVAMGALLLGEMKGKKLVYAGKVGTGFDQKTLRALHARLSPLEIDRPAFADPPRMRGVHWTKPELVVEVELSERTTDGRLRHPTFLGVREDKSVVMPEKKPAKRSITKTRSKRAKTGDPEIRGVRISSPDKILWAEPEVKKLDLARYYERIADRILPHIEGRPLTLVRCPEGTGAACFYQKHSFVGMPDAVEVIAVKEKTETEDYVTVRDVSGLVALAQIGVLEIHPWGSRHETLEKPDRFVIDLDPGEGVSWARVVEAAHEVHARLAEIGLEGFLKTTGGKGLHIVVPIARRTSWDDLKSFTHAIALDLARRSTLYTAALTKAKRRGKIFVDYLRNGRGNTAVAPYSPRKHPGAPISMPIAWKDATAKLDPMAFTVERELGKRDAWPKFFDVKQSITKPMWRALGA